jgi:hypothetical protein
MLGVSYVILYPFIARIAGSFMTKEDVVDATVSLIPKHFTLDVYKYIIVENHYLDAFWHTALISILSALIQTLIACLIGYGLAKFKFKGNGAVMIAVIVSMIIPHSALKLALLQHFAQFDILTLSVIGNGDLKRVISEIDALDERYAESDGSEKEYCDEGCAIINKYLKLVAIYNDTKEKIADVIMQTELVEYYDEWEDMTYTYYKPVPVLVFPDGSKFLFEDFFNESGFGNLFERLGDIAGDIEY